MVNQVLETSHPLSSSALRLRASARASSSSFRTHFQVPYPATLCFQIHAGMGGVQGVAFRISPLATSHSPLVGGLLLLSKLKAPINLAESTLLQVLILKQLKVPLESITFEKQGGGAPLWLTKC
jgi:hypothetical protein